MKVLLKSFSSLLLLLIVVHPLHATSLWMNASNNERSLYADNVASCVGDILTVVVNESTTMSNSLSTKSGKDASIKNTISRWLFSTAASGFGTHHGELPATDIVGSNTYSGTGAIDNKNSLQATVSVTVIDVLPNGNLIIEGARLIAYSKEREFSILRGTVRSYDISPTNTIASSKIADPQIEFLSEGQLSDAQRKGWLMRFNDFVNPF